MYRERERAEAAGGAKGERDGGTGNNGLLDFGLVVGGCP